MREKNKIIVLILLTILLIFLLIKVLSFKNISYNLQVNGKNLKIFENYNKNDYYIEISVDKKVYPLRIYDSLNNKRKVIKDVYYYSDDNIQCILPVINERTYTDFMCYKDSILYDYHNLTGINSNLDKYVSSIDIYSIDSFKNSFDASKSHNNLKFNNAIDKIVAITTYKGLSINGEEINIFKDDVYNNKISTFIDNYYLIADYSNEYSFDYFYIVNLKNKEIKKLSFKDNISYDSYIQGIVDNKVYLYDKDNEIQYEIDINNNNINIVSSGDYIKYYSHNEWSKISKIKANKEVYFNYNTLDNKFPEYDVVKESNDYYYLFKKDGIYYKLYRVDKSNSNIYKYILDIPTTSVEFNNNYMYYVYKNKLYYYCDNVGLKTILEYDELEFNDTIKYYIY